MNTQEYLHPKGELDISIYSSEGLLKEKIHVPNLVVQTGRDYIARRMANTDDGVMSHMSVGEDNTATSTLQTALLDEITGSRTTLDSTAVANNVVTYTATFDPGIGTGAIVEAGIFNAGTSGTMLCRTVFPVVNKAVDDTMVITWTITIS